MALNMQLTKNKYTNLNALGVTVKADVIPAVEASWSNNQFRCRQCCNYSRLECMVAKSI
jgi:hypothetical protein